ncbi:MAG: hypothetical protein LBI99_05410 [Propionibacteriaceae bacterium]|nr:hypothetical protein [Propionibacteriaceae bacterium]
MQEDNDARRACVERYGLVTSLGNADDDPNFGVSSEGVGWDRVYEVLDACDAEVGEFYSPPETEESMTELYGWRLGQYRCLEAAGFQLSSPPPSLQSFLDGWRMEGYGSFDPIGLLPDEDYNGALAACPRTTEKWPD